MAQFHQLKVTHLHKTIRDAVVVTLQPDDEAAFKFTQGQYLTFRKDFEGEELRRSYSICAGTHEGLLQVGIKRVDGGAFSSWANQDLKVGDMVEAMPPMGQFYAASNQDSPHYLAFAGGSGITPILSILKTALVEEPNARFTLIYANRSANTIMFRETLENLKNTYMERFNIIHILEDGNEDIDLFQGRIDAEKCAALFQNWVDIEDVAKAYICGPEPMMLAISEALQKHGMDKKHIRFELFASGQPGRAKKRAATSQNDAADVAGRVTLNGETRSLRLHKDTNLLDAARANNIDAPYACKAGVCSTCKAKVLEGDVEMIANHALEDYEVNAGFVLTCQCYPLTDKVVWDYDQAGH